MMHFKEDILSVHDIVDKLFHHNGLFINKILPYTHSLIKCVIFIEIE